MRAKKNKDRLKKGRGRFGGGPPVSEILLNFKINESVNLKRERLKEKNPHFSSLA